MQINGLNNRKETVAPRPCLGVSLALACSFTVSTAPLLASVPGAPPVWQPVQQPGQQPVFHGGLPFTAHLAHGPNANASTANDSSSDASTANAHSSRLGHSVAPSARNAGIRSLLSNPAMASNDLNLASSQANVLASSVAGFHNLTIVVGGVKRVLSLDSKLTGAEAVAAEQVLAGTGQAIKLGAGGQAIGGSVLLNAGLLNAIDNALGGSINTLTIARGLKVIDNVNLLSLTGSLDNDGSILTAATAAHSNDTISAVSIENAGGALIGSYSGGARGLVAADPVLNAQTSLTNNGTIGSAGKLTINAASVYNMAGPLNAPALPGGGTISALQTININTRTLTNAGMISSSSGNVNTASSASLNVLNSSGTISARDGNINFTTDNTALSVTGGNLLSSQLNLKAQAGDINLNAGNVTGIINASGDSVHVTTASSQNLGNIDTAGDPQFISTAGNITIDGTISPTSGADLAIIAGGNILSTSQGVLNTTGSGNGGNLTLIAGANVIGSDITPATVTDSAGAGKGSTTGGIINLTGGNGGKGAITQITTAGQGATGQGGYVEMVAYAGSASGSGAIKLPINVTINAAGSGTGLGGDVTLIAGAVKSTGITAGAITGNNVTLLSETPSANSGAPAGVVFTGGTSNLGIGGFTGTGSATTATIKSGTVTAAQNLTIGSGGNAGSSGAPLKFDAGQLSVSGTSKSASVFLTDLSGTAVTVASVALGLSGTFSLSAPANKALATPGGPITVSGPVTASTVTLSTPGAISTNGVGNITATKASLTGSTISASTDVTNLTVQAKSGGVTITQGATLLNLTAKLPAGQNLTVDSQNQINLKTLLNLGSQSVVTLDDQAAAGGVNVGAAITAGTVNLTAGDTGLTSSGGAIVNAGIIALSAGGGIGTSKHTFAVNNNLALGLGNTLTITAGTNQSVYIRDRSSSDLSLDANSVTSGNLFSFSSAAVALNIVEAPFANVKITDTNGSGVVTLNSNSSASVLFGTGLGYFNVLSNGDISMNASTAGVQATSVSLTSNRGNVGQTGDLVVTSPILLAQAKRDNASVTDAASGNITVKGNALAAFDLISTGNSANVLIDSRITAGNVYVRAQGTNSNITNDFALGSAVKDQGNSITLTPTGNLTINGKLTADDMILGGNIFTGDPVLLGTVNINQTLVADHSINVFVNQSSGINVNAAVRANAIRFVTANAGANIVLNASLKTVTDPEGDGTILTLQANNANVVTSHGVVVTASDINLTGNNIGTSANPLVAVTGFMNLAVNGGSAYINNTGNVSLNTNSPITAGTVSFINKGSLEFAGSITASVLNLTTTGTMFLGASGVLPLSSLTGTTSLNIAGGQEIADLATLGGPNITVSTPAFLVAGFTLAAPGNLTISNGKGTLFVDGVITGINVTLSGTGPVTIGATLDSPQTSITAPTLTITGAKAIDNFGIVSGATVSATTGTFSNMSAGMLTATSVLSIGNPTGNLILVGPTGSIVTPSGGSLSLTAKGSILAGTATASIISPTELNQLHNLTINAGGNFTAPFSSFSVVADGSGNGGLLSITAANFIYNGVSIPPIAFDLTANGSTAAGGQVILKLTNTPGGVVIGNSVGNYEVDASGANGGTVEVLSSGNLTVDMTSLKSNSAPNGTGSNVTLIAGKNLLINGNLDTHNGATGTFGKVVLQSNSSSPFIIGGGPSTLNGIVGLTTGSGQGALGSSVTITNNSGVIVNTGLIISGATTGITVNTTMLVNNGQVNTPGTLTISNSASVVVPSGTTGTYLPAMTGLDVISTGANVTINAALPPVNDLQLSAAKGTLTLPSSLSSLTATTIGGNGGTIDVTAKTLKASVMSFDAAASTAAGAGGSIAFTLTGTTALNVGSGLTFDVAKGATSTLGGSLTIANGGNLTVDATGLTIGPLSAGTGGANLTLQAGSKGSGSLSISNAATFANGGVSKLVLISNSSQPFALGGAGSNTNGIVDDGVALSAQTITIQNTGAIVQGSGGVLTANATGVLGAITLTAGSGGIGVSHDTPLAISTSNLAVNTTGSAYLSNAVAVSLDSISVGKVFDYASSAGITASAALTAPTLVLNVASITLSIQSNLSTSVAVVAAIGAVTINDALKGLVTVNALSSAGAVSLFTGGAITQAANASISGSSVSVNAGGAKGSIVIGGSVSSPGTVDLNASGTGTITESGQTGTVSAATLNLVTQGGNIGASQTNAFIVNATALSASTGTSGSAFIQNSALTATIAASTVGKTFSYAGNITGASGPISAQLLTLTLSNDTAAVTTNASTLQGTSTSGNLTIIDSQTGLIQLNTLTAGTGQVSITSAGAIATIGAINGAAGVALTAGGSGGAITIGGAVNGQTGTVTLQSAGLGTITGTGATIAGSLVNLTTNGANIGSASKSLALNAGAIAINTGTTGDVYLTNSDSQSSGSVSISASIVGSLKLTETNTTATNTGSLTLNNISAGTGAISIVSNEQALNVAAGSNIVTANGNITLQNTYKANGFAFPIISLGNNSKVHGSAFLPINLNAGNVYIVLGTLPSASQLQAGVVPAGNPAINTSGVGQVTFGTTSNPNGSITAVASDTLSGLDRTLAFNTGANPATQIVLGTNVTVTADPPAALPVGTTLQAAVSIANVAGGLQVSTSATHIQTQMQTEMQSQSLNQYLNQYASQNQYESPASRQPVPPIPILAPVQSIGATNTGNAGAALSDNAVNSLGSSAKLAGKRTTGAAFNGVVSNLARETLDSGVVLMAPAQNTVIDTPFGCVGVAKNSVAMVIASADGLTVYDLHDTHKSSIFINCGDGPTKISLSPGHSATVTHQSVKHFEQVNPAEKVIYRRIAGREIGNEQMVYQGEFEIFSMVHSLSPFEAMLGSNDSAMRKAVNSVIKTASILSQLAGGEPYRPCAKITVSAGKSAISDTANNMLN